MYFFDDFSEYVIYFLIFAAILLPAEAFLLHLLWRIRYRKRVARRIFTDGVANEDEDPAEFLRRVSPFTVYAGPGAPLRKLSNLLLQSGIAWRLRRMLALMAIVSVGVAIMVHVLAVPWVLSVLFAGFAGIGTPVMVLVVLRERRTRLIGAQLPDAIDVLVRNIKAGHPISVAIATVGREMPDPIGREFRVAADEQTYGLDLETAMANMRQRIGHGDLALVVIAVTIQSKSGGNLTEVLSNLSRVIRDRHKLRHKVRALSAEGRASGIALSILPVALFAILWVLSPNFYGDVWEVAYVKPILGTSLIWMTIGILVIYKMVNFRI